MKNIISVVFAATLGFSAVPLSVAAGQGKWDGKWKISIEYSRESSSNQACWGNMFNDPMVITNGRVSGILRHNRRGAVFLSGQVADDGTITARGLADAVEGNIKGKFTDSGASGTFEETKRTYCTGTWTAVRK